MTTAGKNAARNAEAYRRFKAGETAEALAKSYGVTDRAVRNWISEGRKAELAPVTVTAKGGKEPPRKPEPRDPAALERARRAMEAEDDEPSDEPRETEPSEEPEELDGDQAERVEPRPQHSPEEAVEVVGDLKADIAGTIVSLKYGRYLNEEDPRVVAAAKPGALLKRAIKNNADFVDPIVDGATSNPWALLGLALLDGFRMLGKLKRAAIDAGWRPGGKAGEEPAPGKPASAQREAPAPAARPAPPPVPEPAPEGDAPRRGVIRDAPTGNPNKVPDRLNISYEGEA